MTFIPVQESSGSDNVFVYREGEPSPSGNIFATFDGAYLARRGIKGYAVIEVDPSLSASNLANVRVLAGEYNMAETKLLGYNPVVAGPVTGFATAFTTLTLEDGVQMDNLLDLENVIVAYNNTSAPVTTVTAEAGGAIVVLRNAGFQGGSPTQPFWSVIDSGQLNLFMVDSSEVVTSGIISVDSTSEVAAYVLGTSFIGSDVLVGPSGASAFFNYDDTSSVSDVQTAYSGFLGGTQLSSAPEVLYTPTTSGDWAPTPPTEVGGALDILAARGASASPYDQVTTATDADIVLGASSSQNQFAGIAGMTADRSVGLLTAPAIGQRCDVANLDGAAHNISVTSASNIDNAASPFVIASGGGKAVYTFLYVSSGYGWKAL